MQRYKLILAYDGTLFHGFQKQPNQRTIQGVIEDALLKMTKGKHVIVHGSGRTDAGVHAKGQVIHFDYPGNVIPAKNMLLALNALMPRDIIFLDSELVNDDFHVQYSTKAKWYRYIINQSRFTDPFRRNYTGHCPYKLDMLKMKEAATYLLGKHDFTSFAASGGQIVDKVRTIFYINLEQHGDEIVLDVIGDGFLYNMVRIITGLLIDIGHGQKDVEDVEKIILAKDRQKARNTAPASGLYLYHVFYDDLPKKYNLIAKID
ncbi:MAG: tRNA pseudouridine(38-40) synthase TruA [Lactobacillus iners]|nr:tRNA pseudouridine(38-40) synthase TruA [Lactobacillus iners]